MRSRVLHLMFGLTVSCLVAACSGQPSEEIPGGTGSDDGGSDDGGADDGGGEDTGSDALPQPELLSPAEAEDLSEEEGVVEVALTAAPMVHEIVDWRTGESLVISGFAYNGQVPGPTIRAQVGDELRVILDNQLGTDTTIHWHGVGSPWEMDGVTWMQEPIADGESFTYVIPLERAGTFWYHPHFDTDRQVDLGLYGVLIVEDPAEEGAFDRELVAVLDDWASRADEVGLDTAEASEELHTHGDHGHESLWTINGLVQPALPAVGGESIRVRILDASNNGYLWLDQVVGDPVEGEGSALWRIAGDQGRQPEADAPDRLVLAPGDRTEVVLLPGEQGFSLRDHDYVLAGGAAVRDPVSQLDVVVSAPAASAALPDLGWAPRAPSEDPGSTDVRYTFQGDLHTDTWMINGETFPDVTIQQLSLGQDAIIEVRNISSTEHPFHLHGLHFEVLSLDGVAPAQETVEDTLNIPIYGVARLRVLADNPGDWMAHCHILPHAHNGMMTVLRVE